MKDKKLRAALHEMGVIVPSRDWDANWVIPHDRYTHERWRVKALEDQVKDLKQMLEALENHLGIWFDNHPEFVVKKVKGDK